MAADQLDVASKQRTADTQRQEKDGTMIVELQNRLVAAMRTLRQEQALKQQLQEDLEGAKQRWKVGRVIKGLSWKHRKTEKRERGGGRANTFVKASVSDCTCLLLPSALSLACKPPHHHRLYPHCCHQSEWQACHRIIGGVRKVGLSLCERIARVLAVAR